MTETLTVTSERVDDLPLLLAQMERMGLAAVLDAHFPTHGNWVGLSLGPTTVVWLAHLLSQGDHRLNQVQPWVAALRETLARSLGQAVRPLDVADDRLAAVLRALSDDARWAATEAALGQRLLRVYALGTERVRLDSTTASGDGPVTPDGLFQFGHSKDHRPDLPQVKVMRSTLDPLGLPLATDVLPGQRADDPLYVPAIARVRATLGRRGLLYVGDAKMAALETRAVVHAGGDHYLCPLPAGQLPADWRETYLAPVGAGTQPLTPITRTGPAGPPAVIAEGFEREAVLTAAVDGQPVTWTERRLVLRSVQQAERETAALHARLRRAQAALAALTVRRRGKRRPRTLAALQQAAAAVIAQHQVAGLLQVTEAAAGPPLRLGVFLDEVAVETAVQRLGWRVYATEAPADALPLAQAVPAYRQAYLIEHGFGRLKGRPLSLAPMYLQRDDHATGLIRLLTLALRLLTVVQYAIRQRLATTGEALAGLYAGQPTRATARPTTEGLLRAFRGLTLTIAAGPGVAFCQLTPLSTLQQRILALLDFPLDIYVRLAAPPSPQPP
ncbi:MAG: transposase [Chloroflexi bacterium]|nr:transposase [Chloroflexota bacterium]